MNVNRLCVQTVLIIWALTLLSGFNSPLMAQSDSNADSAQEDLSELSLEMLGAEIAKLLSRIDDTRNAISRYEREMEKADQEDLSLIHI